MLLLPSRVALTLGLLVAGGALAQGGGQGAPPPEKLPLGVSPALWSISVPKHLAPTPEKVALGEKLFNDPRLSVDGTVSCATCHVAERAFTDGKARSRGVKNQELTRNSPTVLNALFNATQFWDGRARTLEDQARLPITNPREMAMPNEDAVVQKVRALPEYAEAFRRIYGRDATMDDVANAIAAFERMQFSGNAAFDRFIRGDSKALSASEQRGWALFNGKARCNTCHAGNAVNLLFSDQRFHNIGIAAHNRNFEGLARKAVRIVETGDEEQIDRLALETELSELGRFLVTKLENDIGAFKTPTLRNIGVTGPYMHDGSLVTLWDVMDHYNKGGVQNPYLDGGMQRLGLTEAEIDDVVAFMFTLTDERFRGLNQKELARQRARKGNRPERDTAAAMGKKGNLGDINPTPDLKVKDPADLGLFGAVLEAPPQQKKEARK